MEIAGLMWIWNSLSLAGERHEAAVVEEASRVVSGVVAPATGRMIPVDGRSEPSFSKGPIASVNLGGLLPNVRAEA